MKSMPSSSGLRRGKRHLSKSQINSRLLHSHLGQSEKWLTEHLCQSLDEAEQREDPQLQPRRCQSKAIGILEMRQRDGFKPAFRGSETENTRKGDFYAGII